jgi:glycosyltransferase involved in cell wall biosynthesis
MRLAPCRFRQVVPGSGQMRCTLAQQILGLADSEGCGVGADACRACSRLGIPEPARPNAVVSSLVYNLAREIRYRGGRFDCDIGAAWQAECYARASLAEDPTRAPEAIDPRKSAADRLVRRIPRFAFLAPRRHRAPVIGLVGCGAASGLGYLNCDLAQHGSIDTWLFVADTRFPAVDVSKAKSRIMHIRADAEQQVVRRWLSELDWVVWAEASPLRWLPRLAHQMGVRVACIPMWEWTSPTDERLRAVDLMICPTRHAYRLFTDWKRRFGFGWHLVHFPWPVSADRFHFRLRRQGQKFVFVNGHGGAWARDLESGRPLLRRKGLDIVLSAAALAPEVPWIVYTQHDLNLTQLANVEVRSGPTDHAELYRDGDICVQPSRWEGIGLPLLECQMAGMPLITVDAPPMNEYPALHRLSPARWEWGYVAEGQPIRIPEMCLNSLAEIVRTFHLCDVQAASENAHQWMRSERSWDQAALRWQRIFEEYTPRVPDAVPNAATHSS